jgi:hypothetical protein
LPQYAVDNHSILARPHSRKSVQERGGCIALVRCKSMTLAALAAFLLSAYLCKFIASLGLSFTRFRCYSNI